MKNTEKYRRDDDRSDQKHVKENENSRLQFLSDLSDYKVASDDPDVRGWTVVDDRDNAVGKVDNLLVDTTREKVRYLDVELDNDNLSANYEPFKRDDPTGVHEFQKDGEFHMIVPIGLARLDTSGKRVISEDINRRTLEQGHMHRKGDSISPEFEHKVVSSLRGESYSSSSRHAETGEESTQSGFSDKRSESGATGNRPQAGTKGERPRTERTEENRETQRLNPKDERQKGNDSGRKRVNDDDFYEGDYFDERRFYNRR